MQLAVSRAGLYLAVLAVAAVIVLAGRHYLAGPDPAGQTTARSEGTLPTIGGPFTLVDHNGHTVTDAAFRGRFMLVFFGYTYCPDVCPTSLSTVAAALDLLGEKADQIVPMFISIDPERDTPEALKAFVGHFHPSLVGLTGTLDQIVPVAKAYRVYYAKVREEGAAEDDYLVDHTAITYLMDRDGQFATHFSHNTDPAVMAEKLREFL